MKKLIKFLINNIPRPWLIRLSYFITRLTALWYKGNRFECPVCGGHFRKLLPYGYTNVRENALCPSCLSLERHRLLWMFLQQKTDFFTANHKVLHIAPEQCFVKLFRKQKNLKYTTADLESPLADVKTDVQSMPFENGSYDIVICNHVLEHVPDLNKALSEIHRVLRKGGFAILQVPFDLDRATTYEDNSITDRKKRTEIFGQYDHVRVFGKDYPQVIQNAGFQLMGNNFIEEIDEATKQKFGLAGFEFMYGFDRG